MLLEYTMWVPKKFEKICACKIHYFESIQEPRLAGECDGFANELTVCRDEGKPESSLFDGGNANVDWNNEHTDEFCWDDSRGRLTP